MKAQPWNRVSPRGRNLKNVYVATQHLPVAIWFLSLATTCHFLATHMPGQSGERRLRARAAACLGRYRDLDVHSSMLDARARSIEADLDYLSLRR